MPGEPAVSLLVTDVIRVTASQVGDVDVPDLQVRV